MAMDGGELGSGEESDNNATLAVPLSSCCDGRAREVAERFEAGRAKPLSLLVANPSVCSPCRTFGHCRCRKDHLLTWYPLEKKQMYISGQVARY